MRIPYPNHLDYAGDDLKMEFVESNSVIPENLRTALDLLRDLYEIHDWFFSPIKAEKQVMMQDMVAAITNTLEKLSTDEKDACKPIIAYVKGKALNCFESFRSDSEELLSISVKLDPSNYRAWTALGQCLWKKGDRIQAQNCFQESLNQTLNKEALWELSVLMRQLRIKGQDASVSVEESIKLAKKAIELDVNDHKSWYILGNAWCTRFFSTSYKKIDLNKALNCYKRSETLGGTGNPDLYVNSANVMRYLQEYTEAIQAFKKAQELDPTLKETAPAIEEISAFLNKVNDLIYNNAKIRKSRLDQLQTTLKSSILSAGCVHVSTLSPGENRDVTIIGKPLLPVSRGSMPPKSFLCIDLNSQFFLISIYDIGEDASQFTTDDILTVTHPYLRVCATGTSVATHANTEQNNLQHQVQVDSNAVIEDNLLIVQVFDIRSLRVNGLYINKTSLAAPQLKIETFDA
eukprot:gene10405-21698_t